MFVVVARYYTREGKDDEVAGILRKMIPLSRTEPGCALYVVNRSIDDPRRFVLYEQYYDRSGYQAHMATKAFQEYILGEVVPALETRERDFCEVVE